MSITRLWEKNGHSAPLRKVAFYRDGRHAESVDGRESQVIWDLKGGHPVSGIAAQPDGTASGRDVRIMVPFQFGGKRCELYPHGRDLVLKDITTGATLRYFLGHRDTPLAWAVSLANSLVISGGKDGELRFWALERGESLQVLHHPDWITCLAVSSNGQQVLSGGRDHKVRLYAV